MTTTVLLRRGALGGAVLLAACLSLTACAGGSSAPSAASVAPAPAARTGHAAPQSAATGAALPGAAGAASGTGKGAGSAAGLTAGLAPAGQNIVYTAIITVRAANVAATARRITGIVEASGGYVSAENAGRSSPDATGETIGITLKIPVPAYPDVLAQLSSPALGKQLSMKQQATDVTQEVANVDSLVTSQQDAISALEGLLKHAATVADLLQVQQQISSDESALNSLLAQQRALNAETSYATVTMTLVSPHRAAPRRTASQHSFLTGLLGGWRALRHAAGWLATALGAALPFLAVAAALAAAGIVGRRRYRRRRAAEPPAPA